MKKIVKMIKNMIYSTIFKKSNYKTNSNGFQRIYHNHIRKCAETSINQAKILVLGGNESTYKRLAQKNCTI